MIKNGSLVELSEKKIDRQKVVRAGAEHGPLRASQANFQIRFSQGDNHDISGFFGSRSPAPFS